MLNLKKKLLSSSHKNNKFLNSIKNIKKLISINKDSSLKYWGQDKAILENNRIDKANTQDTERLHFLSQNAIRTGFNWTAYRLAHKSRTDISSILEEIRDIENTMKNPHSKEGTASIQENLNAFSKELEPRRREYEAAEAYPEQGIAINYVLEFLHNFHNNIENSKLSEEELFLLANMIRKSVPKDSDIIESTLAGALRASAKRLIIRKNSDNPQKTEEAPPPLNDEEKKLQNEVKDLKRTG